MRRSFLIAVLFFSTLPSFSQDAKTTNTLLWRISGNGLTKSSYLYGTMHLTDKRVFQLGDSVYRALEKTEGFAAELDMNRIGTQMLNQFFKESEEKKAKEPVKVKDAVSSETWNLYKEQLEKKFYKKAENITVDDLEDLESKLDVDLFKKGDMTTFLDAWLFGQARKQGKWVGGIEDLEDQLEHINKENIEGKIQLALFDDEYYRGGLDAFIKTYTDQNLDSIDAYMYREENGRKDYIMIKRNLKMARRMDSLSAIRSTMFAVGAAHLPGDSGVIALLRRRGFAVTPVISSRKINSDKYISKTADVAWTPVAIENNSYSLQMPGIAETVEILKSYGLDMKLFFDISTMKMYMTTDIELGEERKKLGEDSLFNSLREHYAAEGKVIKEKQITVNGTMGREYRISAEKGQIIMQIFLPAMERVILNAIYVFNEKSFNNSETERFFQSFVHNKNVHPAAAPEKTWTRMDFPLQSFSVEMPLKPKETKDVVSEEGQISYSWQAVDIKGGVFYGMNVSLMKPGMYNSRKDSTYFVAIKDNIKENSKNAQVLDSAFVSVSNYPGYKITLRGVAEAESVETEIIAVARGGLIYYLFGVSTPGSVGMLSVHKFINSFKLLPYDHPGWKKIVSPDSSFITSYPFDLKQKEGIEDDIHPGAKRFIGYDPFAAVSLYIDRIPVPAWYWYNSDTAFLRTRAAKYVSWNDSMANYKVENAGDLKTVSFMVFKPGDHIVKKVKIVLNGDELYEIFGSMAQQDLAGMYDKFYDEFKVTNEKRSADRSKSKINELAVLLKNADVQTVTEIKQWWNDIEFTSNDIPELQKMMLKIYSDFDTSYYSNLNKKIFETINYLDSNHVTVDYIINNYNSVQPGDEYIKGFLLLYLADIQTTESYGLLKRILVEKPLELKITPQFSYLLYDSLKLTATLFPEIMKLAGSEAVWDQVINISSYLLDSGLLKKDVIKEYGKYFIDASKRELLKGKQEIEDDSYRYGNLIKLLGFIASPEAIAQVKRFTRFDAREIKFRTAIALAESNQPADSRTFYTLATIDEYRHQLYDELKRINKLKLFPVIYLSQKELGKSKLYEYASEDDEAPGVITDEGEKIILYKGRQQKFYLYKVSFLDEWKNTYYLGVAGPYPLNQKDFLSSHEATGMYWEKEFDTKDLDKMFREYLDFLKTEE